MFKDDYTGKFLDFSLNICESGKIRLKNSESVNYIKAPFSRLLVTNNQGQRHGKIYYIPCSCGETIKFETKSDIIYFHINVFDNYYNDVFNDFSNPIIIDLGNIATMELFKFYGRGELYNIARLKSIIYNIMARIIMASGLKKYAFKKSSQIIISTAQAIFLNPSIRVKKFDISDTLGLTQDTLNKMFIEETGIDITRFNENEVLFSSAQMLIFTDMSIKSISERMEFCDQFYFSKKFGTHYGVSPLKYRKIQRSIGAFYGAAVNI